MIGRVLANGVNVAGLIRYLYGPGKANEHHHPHLVAGWRYPQELEPPVRPNGRRDLRMLISLLLQPVTALGDRAPARPVWHCVVRAAPDDPDLGDGAWMAIAERVMDRTGLSPRGQEDEAVRWIAVHHGDNHIHIVATLARQDGSRAHLHNEYYRIGETLREVEREYGLRAVGRPDRTAAKSPTRAEFEKAARAGRSEPARVQLRRQVIAAAARARSEEEFFAELGRRGVQVRLRHSPRHPGEVTGYAVGLRGDVTAAGTQIWFGGGQLAADLTLPKLRRRWNPPDGPGPGSGTRPGPGSPGRLHGHAMTAEAARATLRAETGRCAVTARTEPEFFAALARAGLLVQFRTGPGPDGPGRPGPVAGYAVSLPGLTSGYGGPQRWYAGHSLAAELGLAAMRARWRAGRPGTPPRAGLLTGPDATSIYSYAAQEAAAAARQIRAAPPGQAADIALAAADVLAVAAEATASPELARAAEAFTRAARASWARVPAPCPAGAGLRTAAYLMAGCSPGGQKRAVARVALLTALTGLSRAVADTRTAQQRLSQARAAHQAASRLTVITAGPPIPVPAPLLAEFPPLKLPAVTRPGARPRARRPTRPSVTRRSRL